MKDKMTSDELMKTPVATVMISIMNEATQIQCAYHDQLVLPPSGLYAAGQLNPCLVSDKVYYEEVLHNGVTTLQPIQDINTVKNAIYDQHHQIVLNKFQVINKDKWLKPYPTVPATALKIVYYLLQLHFDSICPYKSFNHNTTDKILRLLKPGCEDLYHSGELENVVQNLFSRVSDFIRTDNWNIYFQKFIGCDVLIEKMCDYRIYDWYLIKEEAERQARMDSEIQDHGNIRC